jgi:hypothetical protein
MPARALIHPLLACADLLMRAVAGYVRVPQGTRVSTIARTARGSNPCETRDAAVNGEPPVESWSRARNLLNGWAATRNPLGLRAIRMAARPSGSCREDLPAPLKRLSPDVRQVRTSWQARVAVSQQESACALLRATPSACLGEPFRNARIERAHRPRPHSRVVAMAAASRRRALLDIEAHRALPPRRSASSSWQPASACSAMPSSARIRRAPVA